MDELDERLELAYAAKTYADLAAVTKDLPQPGQVPGVAQPVATSRIGGTPRYKFSIAIMSGARRRGRWVVPRTYVAGALMGGVELDLREAQFSVPEDVDVNVSDIAFMGGFDHNTSGPGIPKAPQIRVIGFALMGGVDVKR